ncbi:MAG: acyl-CoA thioesterase [Mojavia pulchra JT2-VF2]|jgi:acyl-CoA thioester hydrolase|uniref:Acyl-CoA thioesterase n=1 Tax=Mojavia pulchra JT2-VF2 TaxID=287848 RepID=A0A951Q6L2_9NOST|nr:acyl-CoA thioesterase [Mojavia pulchra JT2-VF2]
MSFELVSLRLQVRPNDLDSLGHVNNATVLEYLETGRWDWLKHHNLQIKQKIVPVVARIEVNYRKVIILEDVIINTKLEAANKTSLYQANFWQSIEIFKEGNPLVAVEARIQLVFIDSTERTLRTLQEFLAASNNSNSIN